MGIIRKTVKIRKPHRCAACSEYFPKNTKMITTTTEEGGYYSIYRCESCQESIDKLEIDQMVDGFNETMMEPTKLAEFNSTLDPQEYLELKRKERKK